MYTIIPDLVPTKKNTSESRKKGLELKINTSRTGKNVSKPG
jgi:hypothetical protein